LAKDKFYIIDFIIIYAKMLLNLLKICTIVFYKKILMSIKKPSLFLSLIPVLVLIGLLITNVLLVFGDDALSGSTSWH